MEEKKLCEEKNTSLSTLKQLREKEVRVRNVCEKIYLKLSLVKKEELWGSMEKLVLFCKEARMVERYFCPFDKMVETL